MDSDPVVVVVVVVLFSFTAYLSPTLALLWFSSLEGMQVAEPEEHSGNSWVCKWMC